MNAHELANRVLEGEDPKNFLKRVMPTRQHNLLDVGEELIHGTGITRDIMDACLERLKQLDRNRYLQEISDEDVFNYSSLGEAGPDFDPEYYLYEHLFDVMQKFCPPFTHFGSNEADGAIGCWPPDHMYIEEMVDMGKLTHVSEDQTEWADRIHNGDFTGVDTDYVLIEYDGDMELWSKTTKQKIWHW